MAGGSGGHITPVLAVVSELKSKYQKVEIVFIGSKGGIEGKLIPEKGIKALTISSGKFRRYHRNTLLNVIDPTTIFKNARDFLRFIAGIFDSLKILKEEEPDIVFLKGGYVSLPVGIACRIKRCPYFTHESDVIPGLANKILLKKAKKIFVSHPLGNFPDINKEKLVYSGNPIRKDILEGDKKRAYELFELKKDLKTILVLGGSQGARKINEIFSEKLNSYLEKYQVIHISGDFDYDWLEYKSKSSPNKERYKLAGFLTSELKDAYQIADIVITRAGVNVLTEIAALKKPALVIPLESSANDHQLANAKAYSREGAVYVMLQNHLTSEKLFSQVDRLLDDPEELSFMSEKINKFYKPDAAGIIADSLISFYKDSAREREEASAKKKPKNKQD